MDHQKVQFVLVGFSEVSGCRVFEFEAIAADRTRRLITVTTDMAMARRYGIRLQELPLLCREVLERSSDVPAGQRYEYAESDMRSYADGVTAREAAAKQRKAPRRPAPEHSGTAWRTAPSV